MAGVTLGGARGIALGGGAVGMALLAGEPMTAALGLLPMLVVAARRLGPLRAFLTTAGAGAVGLAVAAPQVVATLRILGFSLRGSYGVAHANAFLAGAGAPARAAGAAALRLAARQPAARLVARPHAAARRLLPLPLRRHRRPVAGARRCPALGRAGGGRGRRPRLRGAPRAGAGAPARRHRRSLPLPGEVPDLVRPRRAAARRGRPRGGARSVSGIRAAAGACRRPSPAASCWPPRWRCR